MLVLSRKCGESIIIAGNITVTVLEVKGSRMKLGVTAPGETSVHRVEVYQKIGKEKSSDASSANRLCSGGKDLASLRN